MRIVGSSTLKLALLVSALAPAAGARAQSGGTGPQPAKSDEIASVAQSGEIVVTATRQAQVLSRVPISISAFSQETMDVKGIKSFEDVARFTPGVRFDPAGNSISIRGISSSAGAGTTGIYIDDTPIQIRGLGFSADNSLPAIFDLERVEVLRGPQGTLFGAGSEGGTVRYITPQPGLKDWSSFARAEVSTTAHGGESYEGGLAIGGPIVPDVLGFRVSGWRRRDGGYVDHVDPATGRTDDKNINHGRLTVLRAALAYEPLPELTITPSVYYQKRVNHAEDAYFEGLSDQGRGVFRTSSPEYRGDKDTFYLPTLNVQYDFGRARLISNSSYYHRNNYTGYNGTIYDLSYYQGLYLDGCGDDCPLYPFLTPTGINPDLPFYLSPSLVTNTQRVFTQEVRLQSSNPDARLNWVVGVFYQHSKQRSIEELIDPLGDRLFNFAFGTGIEDYFEYPLYGQDSYISQTNARESQLAGFVDLTFAVTARLKLTAGARYAKTKYAFVNFADGSQNYGRTDGVGRSSEKPFTPKVGVNFQANDNNLFYATWAKGFRVGGANPPVPVDACQKSLTDFGLTGASPSYGSDKVRSIEVGSKNKFADRRVQIAASAYQIKWSGIQQSVFLPSCAIQFTDNLGNARSRGFDLQATLLPIGGLTVDAAVGYNQTRYTSTTNFLPADPSRAIVNRGNAIEGPPWVIAVGGQYDFGALGREIYLRGDMEYQSRLDHPTPARDPTRRAFDPELIAPSARTFVSLRTGTVVSGANVSLFVDNLLDSAPRLSRTHSDSDTLLFTRTTVRPRTFGLTVTYRQ